jgi:hypothetical protein
LLLFAVSVVVLPLQIVLLGDAETAVTVGLGLTVTLTTELGLLQDAVLGDKVTR